MPQLWALYGNLFLNLVAAAVLLGFAAFCVSLLVASREHIVQKVRQTHYFISEKLLDWAERLPRSNIWPVARFQRIRSSQKAHSEKVFQETRSPPNTSIEMLYIRLFDVFQVDEFSDIEGGMTRLFPSLGRMRRHRSTLIDARRLAESISEAGALRLGVISAQPNLFGDVASTELNTLPNNDIAHVDVTLHKFIPSLFAISFDIYPTDEAREQFHKLCNQRYLSTIDINKLLSWNKFSLETHNTHQIMADTIFEWLKHLQRRCEAYSHEFVEGFFSRSTSRMNKYSSMPMIEVYASKGIPTASSEFVGWKKCARSWPDALGFNVDENVYGNLNQILTFSKYTRADEPKRFDRVQQLLVWESFFDAPKSNTPLATEISDHIANVNNDWFMFVVILELLTIIQHHIEMIRKSAFRRMKSRFTRVSGHLKLYEQINREKALLSIIQHEFAQVRDRLPPDMPNLYRLNVPNSESETVEQPNLHASGLFRTMFRKLGEWSTPVLASIETSEQGLGKVSFYADMDSIFRTSTDRLIRQMSLLEDAFSTYAELRNMQAIHFLQLIAAIGAIAAIASLISIDAIIQTIEQLLLFMNSL